MNSIERRLRAATYRWIVENVRGPSIAELAAECGVDPGEAGAAMVSLQQAHLIALDAERSRVVMAHPFSGAPTEHRAVIGDRSWHANCAWDALAILAIMGDGSAVTRGLSGDDLVWNVSEGEVSPGGVIHLRVPARNFWDNIGFT